ncbi:MAG: hypothetical protein ACKO28_04915 [Cyanobium sp.]|jgi:ribosomal protein L32
MQRSSFPWLWVGLAALLLIFPGPAGRFFLDVLGGLTLLLLILPLIGAGVGVLAWQLIRRRLHTCEACGTISLASQVCPACGSTFEEQTTHPAGRRNLETLDPSKVTINVEAVDVEPSTDGNNTPPP